MVDSWVDGRRYPRERSVLMGLMPETLVLRAARIASPLRVALGAAAVVLGVTTVARFATHHSFGYFTRDPAQVTHAHAYLGFVSYFGLFGWCVGATSLAFGAFLAHLRGARDRQLAFTVGALALAYLLADDAFLLHDGIYVGLGLSDHLTEPLYVLVTAFLLVKGRAVVRETNWWLLVCAGAFFAASIAFDLATDDLRYVIFEDGFKLTGILVLAAYCVDTAVSEARAGHPTT
jgi:hypothetical protein